MVKFLIDLDTVIRRNKETYVNLYNIKIDDEVKEDMFVYKRSGKFVFEENERETEFDTLKQTLKSLVVFCIGQRMIGMLTKTIQPTDTRSFSLPQPRPPRSM